jgi:hypothetical protein
MADIFISYSRKEARPTRDVAAFLTSEGYMVWWDLDLVPGDRVAEIIERELNAADAVIVIWTNDAVVSDWVISEAEHGRRQGKLIPLKTRDLTAPIPKPFDAAIHTGFADDRTAILAAVRRLVGVRTTDQAIQETKQYRAEKTYRPWLSHALATAMGFLLFASVNWWPSVSWLLGNPSLQMAIETQPRPPVGIPSLRDPDAKKAADISKVVTALATVPSSMAGMKISFGASDGGESAMNVAKGLGIGFGGPTAVHLIGTFAINNFGGLGGAL